MARQQGYYSLVQFCPDPARAEVANLGVLLFSPEHSFIDVQMSRSYQRVRTVFPQIEYDAGQLRSMLSWMKDRLDVERNRFHTKDDLCRFVGTRFNDVRLTDPRSIVVERPEEQLKALFAELVALPNREERVSANTFVARQLPFPEVANFFRRSDIARHTAFEQEFVVPVSGRKLDVPFVFTNGAVSMVKPEHIPTFGDAEKLFMDGLLLTSQSYPDEKRREFLVVAEVKSARLRDQVGQLSSEVGERGVRFYVDSAPLMAELEAKAVAH